jgi:transposase
MLIQRCARPFVVTTYRYYAALDLDDEQAAALIALLKRAIADDPYPFSPRIRTLSAILAKLRAGAGWRASCRR